MPVSTSAAFSGRPPLRNAGEPILSPGGGRGMALGPLPLSSPNPGGDTSSPWQSGPRELVVHDPATAAKPAMAGVFSSQPRARRASSLGDNALKRLSKAIDSITIPSGFIPSIPTPSFLSPNPHRGDISFGTAICAGYTRAYFPTSAVSTVFTCADRRSVISTQDATPTASALPIGLGPARPPSISIQEVTDIAQIDFWTTRYCITPFLSRVILW